MHMSGIPFLRFSGSLLPAAAAGLVLEYWVLRASFRTVLAGATIRRTEAAHRTLEMNLNPIVATSVQVQVGIHILTGVPPQRRETRGGDLDLETVESAFGKQTGPGSRCG